MKIDCDHIGYEVSWEDSLLDVVDNFIHMVFKRTVMWTELNSLEIFTKILSPKSKFTRVSMMVQWNKTRNEKMT